MSCDHDKRFSGVFDLPKEDGGCLACALERGAREIEALKAQGGEDSGVAPRSTDGNKELANTIAREIFLAGDLGSDKAQRMAFKGGKYPGAETNLGGYCEKALARNILLTLEKEEVA